MLIAKEKFQLVLSGISQSTKSNRKAGGKWRHQKLLLYIHYCPVLRIEIGILTQFPFSCLNLSPGYYCQTSAQFGVGLICQALFAKTDIKVILEFLQKYKERCNNPNDLTIAIFFYTFFNTRESTRRS